MFAKVRLNSIMELVKPAFRNSNKFSASFVRTTSDNTFPSNAIDYMVSASSPSAAGSASVPNEATPTSAPDIARPINTPDQATTASTTYDDPSLSSY